MDGRRVKPPFAAKHLVNHTTSNFTYNGLDVGWAACRFLPWLKLSFSKSDHPNNVDKDTGKGALK